jgi:hypothetical protein
VTIVATPVDTEEEQPDEPAHVVTDEQADATA